MSGQRVRRNASPMKATLPVALMRPSGSTAESPTSTLPRFSTSEKVVGGYAEQRISPAGSPVAKEKPKSLNSSKNNSGQSAFASSLSSNSGGSSCNSGSSSILSTPSGAFIRRTGSLDTLYLAATGNNASSATATATVSSSLAATKDAASLLSLYGGYCGRLMVDRATQTPEEWEDHDRKKGHQRKISEGLEMKYIRQRLQRSTQLSRGSSGGVQQSGGPSPQPAAHPSQILPRFSPVQGAGSSGGLQGGTMSSPSSAHYSINSISTSSGPILGASSSSPSMYQQPHHFLPGHSGPPLLSQQQQQQFTATLGVSSHTTSIPHGAFVIQSAAPIPIPHIPKPLIPRMRSSVEGLNQEIEKLVLRGISGNDVEGETERAREPTPDGHRAPIAKLFRTTNSKGGISSSSGATSTVDTQTPSAVQGAGAIVYGSGGVGERPSSHQWSGSVSGASGAPDVFLGLTGDDGSGGSSAATSRSQSVSPTVPLIPGSMDNSRPPSSDDRKSASPEDSDHLDDCKFGTSPQINKFLAREPPDGCEKIKLVEEPHQMCPLVVEPYIGRGSTLINGSGAGNVSGTGNIVLRPSVNFVLMPSQSSAFHPLYKPFLPPSGVSPSSSSSSPSSLAVVDGISPVASGTSAFLSTLVVNRGTASTPPASRSPFNERL